MTNEKTMTMAEAVKCCLDGSATVGYLTQADLEALATRYFWIMKPEFTAPAGRPCIHLNADTADFRKFKQLDDGLHAICRGAGINEIRTVTSDMIHAGTLPDSAKEGDLLIVIKGAVSAEEAV